MSPQKGSARDAIAVYTIAVSFLRDEAIGSRGAEHELTAKQIQPDVFVIFRRKLLPPQDNPFAPLAKCAYHEVDDSWEVTLASGEMLILVDKDNVWDVPWSSKVTPLTRRSKSMYSRKKS